MVSALAKTDDRPGRPPAPRADPARVAAFREQLRQGGQTIAGWARANHVNARLTYKVLSGEIAGDSGAAHAIAVKLGLKDSAPAHA